MLEVRDLQFPTLQRVHGVEPRLKPTKVTKPVSHRVLEMCVVDVVELRPRPHRVVDAVGEYPVEVDDEPAKFCHGSDRTNPLKTLTSDPQPAC
jgi:hypothetical protein